MCVWLGSVWAETRVKTDIDRCPFGLGSAHSSGFGCYRACCRRVYGRVDC